MGCPTVPVTRWHPCGWRWHHRGQTLHWHRQAFLISVCTAPDQQPRQSRRSVFIQWGNDPTASVLPGSQPKLYFPSPVVSYPTAYVPIRTGKWRWNTRLRQSRGLCVNIITITKFPTSVCVHNITESYKHFTAMSTFKIHLNPCECTHVCSTHVANDRVACPLYFLLPSRAYLVLNTETLSEADGKVWEMGEAKNWSWSCPSLRMAPGSRRRDGDHSSCNRWL